MLCEMMKIKRSSFYAWKKKDIGKRIVEDKELKSMIVPVFEESHQTYGARRLQSRLKKDGFRICRRRVRRLMKEEGLVAKQSRKWHPPTTAANPKHEKADNLLEQDFHAEAPNQKWVTDITYIPTKEGWLYLAAILDLHSRIIVGWSMKNTLKKELVIDAWNMACKNRKPPKQILHHSDLGSQYTSKEYLNLLREHKCRISMSGKGNCYDNACMESFFATLKAECADRTFETRQEAKTALFDYIEIWYNRKRLHSTLGYLSPLEFEMRGTGV